MKNKISVILLVLSVLLVLLPFFSCGGEKVKPNILLITIDTLRRDHLGAYGYPRETSPFMDQLARDGVLFKYVVTPQPQTGGSDASILTSLHPLSHGVTFNYLVLSENVQTIAEVLKKNGYYTMGAIAVKLLAKKQQFSQGFDSFSDEWEPSKERQLKGKKGQRTASSVNESLMNQVDDYLSDTHHRNKPLFIWVHYYDPHGPYIGRDHISFRNKLPDHREKNKKIRKYDEEIRYTDDAIKEFYGYLEKKALTRRLVTCITADHGETFGEHGLLNGHIDFYSETTLVPLIFHGYGILKNKIIDTYVSTMDIAVTLLGTADLAFDSPVEGVDLFKMGRHGNQRKHTPGTPGSRKFLVINTQKWARSLQLLDAPFAYILNFDHHYKYWYISTYSSHNPGNIGVVIDNNRFKPVRLQDIEKNDNEMIIALPRTRDRGLNYAVLRCTFTNPKNEDIKGKVRVKVYPRFFTEPRRMKIQASPPGNSTKTTLEVIYPITLVDRISIHLALDEKSVVAETIVNNMQYAFITAQEFDQNSTPGKKIKNRIWELFLTQRKESKANEFFDLSTDIEMKKNLVEIEKFKSPMVKYRKLIYSMFKYYHQKRNKLIPAIEKEKKLSEEDKKLLKSLGYL